MGFKDQLSADLDNVFFNTNEFAQNITYKGLTIKAIVKKGELPAMSKGGVSYKAKIEIKKSDVTSPKIHDEVAIDLESWLVEGIEGDDGFILRLRLRKNEASKFGK